MIFAILAVVAFASLLLANPGQTLESLFAPTYDGWKVGAVEKCPNGPIATVVPAAGQPSLWDCDASLAVWLKAARDGFDCHVPSHAPVVRATLHEPVVTHITTGIGYGVVVFELSDGTVRAIGVRHTSFDYQSPVTAIDQCLEE